MTGIELIVKEREHQISNLNYTVEKDVKYNNSEQLIEAVTKLILNNELHKATMERPPLGWDIEGWVRLCKKSYEERIVIAGALLAAKLDSLEYIKNHK